MMHILKFLLLGGAAVTYGAPVLASHPTCGDPPIVANTTEKLDLEGRASALTKYVADANLASRIERTKSDVFEKYPEGGYTRATSFLQYQVCVLIMDDRSMTTPQKLDALEKANRSWTTPPKKKIIIQANNAFIDNTDSSIPPMNFRLSSIEFYVDGERQNSYYMTEAFPAVDLEMLPGRHTFEFVADLYVRGRGSHKSNCKGLFDVGSQSSYFSPAIRLEGIQGRVVSVRGCSLRPR